MHLVLPKIIALAFYAFYLFSKTCKVCRCIQTLIPYGACIDTFPTLPALVRDNLQTRNNLTAQFCYSYTGNDHNIIEGQFNKDVSGTDLHFSIILWGQIFLIASFS